MKEPEQMWYDDVRLENIVRLYCEQVINREYNLVEWFVDAKGEKVILHLVKK